jgi:hypothetical protein
MATPQPYFIKSSGVGSRGTSEKNKLPLISTNLDSVRSYQWEIHFQGLPPIGDFQQGKSLTLAAKQVTQIGHMVEDIEVHRFNEKVYYPGKASTEDLKVTFDNLYQPQMADLLYNWFQGTYNPVDGRSGTMRSTTGSSSKVKGTAVVLQMDGKGNVVGGTKLYGVYPKAWKLAEFNYATSNEFHTIEMTLRFDFAVQYNSSDINTHY